MDMRGRMWWSIDAALLSDGNNTTAVSIIVPMMETNSHGQTAFQSLAQLVTFDSFWSCMTNLYFIKMTSARHPGLTIPIKQHQGPKAMGSP